MISKPLISLAQVGCCFRSSSSLLYPSVRPIEGVEAPSLFQAPVAQWKWVSSADLLHSRGHRLYIVWNRHLLKMQTSSRFNSEILIQGVWGCADELILTSMWYELNTWNQETHLMRICIKILELKMLISWESSFIHSSNTYLNSF